MDKSSEEDIRLSFCPAATASKRQHTHLPEACFGALVALTKDEIKAAPDHRTEYSEYYKPWMASEQALEQLLTRRTSRIGQGGSVRPELRQSQAAMGSTATLASASARAAGTSEADSTVSSCAWIDTSVA